MMPRWIRYCALGVIVLGSLTCTSNAPRDNPYDPNAPGGGFILHGTVYTFYPPFRPLSGVQVHLFPGGHEYLTGGDGYYRFSGLKPGQYTMYCSRSGYQADTVRITLNGNSQLDCHLDALPQFLDVQVVSHHIARFFPPDDLYLLEVTATVGDSDGGADIQQVHLLIEGLAMNDTLNFVEFTSTYAARFAIQRTAEQLGVTNLQQLIGRPIRLMALDNAGARSLSPEQYIRRIIEKTPVTVSPGGLVSIPDSQATITFQWQPLSLPFPFTYEVEIYRLDFGLLTLVGQIRDIPSTETSVEFVNNLLPGDHFWVLYVRDEFGNTSRSRESAFRIVQ